MKILSSTRLLLFHFMKVILWQNLNQIEQYLGGAVIYELNRVFVVSSENKRQSFFHISMILS